MENEEKQRKLTERISKKRAEGTEETEEATEEATEENMKKYLHAAEIGKKVFKMIDANVKAGIHIIDLVSNMEKTITDLGGGMAFPVNVSCNEYAAHDTATIGDNRVLGEKDVAKIDVGVHIDGYIVDAAVTVDLSGNYGKLLDAAKEAVENAISTIRAGRNAAEIGKVIEDTIKKYNYRPIENLGGHSLGRYNLHSGIEIPNYAARSGAILQEGDIVAIEPFATTGVGYVVETATTNIFSATPVLMPTRSMAAREIFNSITQKYNMLPFAERWVIKKAEDKIALRELVRNGSLKSYPVLKEKENGIVAQFEHTVIVEKDSANILL